MNNKLFKLAFGVVLTAVTLSASAQKNYTQGVANYNLSIAGNDVESKVYFTADSNATLAQYGPATVKILLNNKHTYAAIAVDVPVASMKKAAILTQDEIDQLLAGAPKFTFTPASETKQINGFNCKKVISKDTKSGATYNVWVTNDITAPVFSLNTSFADAGGFPVQFTTMQRGQVVDYTLKSISDEKIPAGTFGVPVGYDKISLDDLNAMGGGR